MFALALTGAAPWLVLVGTPAAIVLASAIAAIVTRVARGYQSLGPWVPQRVVDVVDRAAGWCLDRAFAVADRVRPLPEADDPLAPVVALARDDRSKIA